MINHLGVESRDNLAFAARFEVTASHSKGIIALVAFCHLSGCLRLVSKTLLLPVHISSSFLLSDVLVDHGD